MVINTIWLGSDIPLRYNKNIQRLRELNKELTHIHWQERDILPIIQQNNLEELYKEIPFISKLNLSKYLILNLVGGIFTDLDIYWKIPFLKIAEDQSFDKVQIVLSYNNFSDLYIADKKVKLLDDPFIITRPGLFKQCIDYRLKRTLRLDPETGQVHKAEPIGPFLLTEWIYNTNIEHSKFSQENMLEYNGLYGDHEQLQLWNR